jgi:hypothetical protein
MAKRTIELVAVPVEGPLFADGLQRSEVEVLLVAIQEELDDIGVSFGMQQRRAELKRRKDELLDRLLELRAAAV